MTNKILTVVVIAITIVSGIGNYFNSHNKVLAEESISVISQTGWTLLSVDSEELNINPKPATSAFDGNAGTIWHTEWRNADPLCPHEIQIDLGEIYDVGGFRYLPRQGLKPWDENGRIKDYEFYVSLDGINWGTVVANGIFINSNDEQEILFTKKTGRYVRLVALSEVNNNSWTTVAELNVLEVINIPDTEAPSVPTNLHAVITSPSKINLAWNMSVDNVGVAGYKIYRNGEQIAIIPETFYADTDFYVDEKYNYTIVASNASDLDVEFCPETNTHLITIHNASGVDIDEEALSSPETYIYTVSSYDASENESALSEEFQAVTVLEADIISQDNWTLHYVDSEELNEEYNPAINAFDGDSSTSWHTEWYEVEHPHEIQINLGGVYELEGFNYLPRQIGQNGRIEMYEFYVSLDGINWNSPIYSGFFSNTYLEQEIFFPRVDAQYIRLVALSEVNNGPWTSIAELNVVGIPFFGNYMPNSVIDTPNNNSTINVGESINFAGTATDEDNSLPLEYVWDFNDPTIPDMFVEDPGEIVFNNLGVYTVTFTATDNLGRSDTTPATRIISVVENSDDGIISQDTWMLHSVDSEELINADNSATNSFDGNVDTLWTTKWYSDVHPHQISINLGSVRELYGFKYLPRQDNGAGSENGRIDEYQFYVSVDGINWENAVATGVFINDATEKTILFSPAAGQFVRLVGLNEVNENIWMSMAELNILGNCVEPFVQIINPQTNGLQQAPNLEITVGVCLNPELHTDWGVKFVVDNDVAEQTIILPSDGIIFADTFKAIFTDLELANHTIEAFIVDDQGNIVAGEATHHNIHSVGLGDYYVALGDSITDGIGDDYHEDDISQDKRNFSGGYLSVLNNLLTIEKEYPHTVVNEGLPGEQTHEGASRLSSVIAQHPKAKYYLIQYGTNDRLNNLPSGLGKLSGDAGYENSYKDFMQQMIDLVTNIGAEAYLAKIPSQYPLKTEHEEYNLVIDELLVLNSISVSPNFYTYFQNHPEGMSADGFHPNGLGYQGMANLWFEEIIN